MYQRRKFTNLFILTLTVFMFTGVPVALAGGLQSSGVPMQSLEIAPSAQTIDVEGTAVYKAILHVSGQPDKDVTSSCQWYLDDNIGDMPHKGVVIGKVIGSTKINAIYTLGHGSTKADLTVRDMRQLVGSNNASLDDLTLSTGSLNPAFAKETYSYSSTTEDTSTTVTPTADTGKSSITVNGAAVITGHASSPISLTPGKNTVKVVVTSEDGTVKKTYTVTVTRTTAIPKPTTTIPLPSPNPISVQLPSSQGPSTGTGDTSSTVTGTGAGSGGTTSKSASPTVLRLYIGSTEYYVNNQVQSLDAAPIISGGRTLLPIRYVAAPLGASVDWKADEQKVTVALNGRTIDLWIGQGGAKVNGVSAPIDTENPEVTPIVVPPGRTMLPLRFIAEQLGCRVDWDQAQQLVTVTGPQQ